MDPLRFYVDNERQITFTIEQLEKLLNLVYDCGRGAANGVIIPLQKSPLNDDLAHTQAIYCTNDNSIGRIILEPEN